jgi:hypothetical protein
MEKIYKLIDPRNGKVRYIGYTNNKLQKRLRSHIRESLRINKTHKHKWIRSLLRVGLLPQIKIVKFIKPNSNKSWQLWETHYIVKYKNKGFKLVNATEGGEGVIMTPEIRAKIGLKSKGRIHSIETRQKMSKAKLGKTGKDCPNSKGLIAYNETEEIFFHSMQDAENYFKSLGLKASKKNISQCLNSYLIRGKFKRTKVAGFKFKRV